MPSLWDSVGYAISPSSAPAGLVFADLFHLVHCARVVLTRLCQPCIFTVPSIPALALRWPPQRLKPVDGKAVSAGPEALLHPKSIFCSLLMVCS